MSLLYSCIAILKCFILLYLSSVGDIDDDEEVLDWLTDPSNMELTEHIEKVNRKMFAKIRQNSENVAVFFCEIIIINYYQIIFRVLAITEVKLLSILKRIIFRQ